MAIQRKQKQRNKRTPRGRVIIAIVAIILLLAGALVWILNIEHIIQGDWSNVLPVIFVALGVIFALLAWLFLLSREAVKEQS